MEIGDWKSLSEYYFNGLVGQGNTPEQSIDKLKQAIESFSEFYEAESNIYLNPLAINELHEFLTLEDAEASDTNELVTSVRH
ncbi:hypothetical protein [Tychonema sp. BBK16]|uniref:hypothetical protein n=1 Tax=Tychonema sp. BBK16 TaxID=2699888 RepID=UPI001F1D786D|nr:hypothetical protein [Tychonema sp. BBK16]MCF6374337.1 hypothetical protein [Tychonema sp. BBK16]